MEYDTSPKLDPPCQENFNSHTHVEYDYVVRSWKNQDGNFNSHTHVEYDAWCASSMMIVWISTHTLTWSTTCPSVPACPAAQFQLTHSRGVRRVAVTPSTLASAISTHTLTWSTTGSTESRKGSCKISTHTLTWSTTSKRKPARWNCAISTHTLTWSTTGMGYHRRYKN